MTEPAEPTSHMPAPEAPPQPAPQDQSQTLPVITYSLEAADVKAFGKAAFSHPALHWFWRTPGLSLIALVMLMLVMFIRTGETAAVPIWHMGLIGLLALFYAVLLGYFFVRIMNLSRGRENGYVMGMRQVELDPEGLVITSDLYQSAITWKAFIDILETDTHLFLMLERGLAEIIPKRAFRNPIDAQMFAACCRERWELSRPGQQTDLP